MTVAITLWKIFTFSIIISADAKHNAKNAQCLKDAVKLSECCKLPSHPLDQKCAETYDVHSGDDKSKMVSSICYEDCVFKSNGLISDEGVIDKAKFENYVKEIYGEKHVEQFGNGTDFCINMVATKTKSMPPMKIPCNTHAYFFVSCMWLHLMRHCPETSWNDSPTCNELKAAATPIDRCFES